MHTHITTPCSSSRWTEIRHVSLQREDGLDYRLQFGMEAATFTPLEINDNTNTIISRGISTVPLTLNNYFPTMSTTTTTVAMATTEIVLSKTTTSAEFLEDNIIIKHIRETSAFNRIHALVS